MQKILISLSIVLFLAILPQAGFGQIPTLDKLNLDSNPSPQCLDFNQDKICEFIVLANGTRVENPDRAKQVTQAQSQATSEPVPFGECLGQVSTPDFCNTVMLVNGSIVDNPRNQSIVTIVPANTISDMFYKNFFESQDQEQEQKQTSDSNDNDNDNDNDDDNEGGAPDGEDYNDDGVVNKYDRYDKADDEDNKFYGNGDDDEEEDDNEEPEAYPEEDVDDTEVEPGYTYDG